MNKYVLTGAAAVAMGFASTAAEAQTFSGSDQPAPDASTCSSTGTNCGGVLTDPVSPTCPDGTFSGCGGGTPPPVEPPQGGGDSTITLTQEQMIQFQAYLDARASADSSSSSDAEATVGDVKTGDVNVVGGTTIYRQRRQAPAAIAPAQGVGNRASFGVSTPFGGISFGGGVSDRWLRSNESIAAMGSQHCEVSVQAGFNAVKPKDDEDALFTRQDYVEICNAPSYAQGYSDGQQVGYSQGLANAPTQEPVVRNITVCPRNVRFDFEGATWELTGEYIEDANARSERDAQERTMVSNEGCVAQRLG